MNIEKFNKKIKPISIIIIVLLLITLISLSLWRITDNGNVSENNLNISNNNKESRKDDYDKCSKKLQENIPGRWAYPGGDVNYLPTIEFEEDKFSIYDAANPDDSASGVWEFNKSDNLQLKLIFDNYDNTWIDILDTDLSRYPNIVDYNYEEKFIILRFNYLYDANNTTRDNCEIDNFFIDLFNFNLYKTTKN
jgi:hypothetical protein